MSGGMPTPARRSRRGSTGLSRQQRLAISVVAAALGLGSAYWINRPAGAELPAGGAAVGSEAVVAERTDPAAKLQQLHASRKDPQAVAKAVGGTAGAGSSTGAAGAASGAKQASSKQGVAAEHANAAGGQQQQQQQQQAKPREHVVHPGMEDEREWFVKLSPGACGHMDDLRVCSHRARLSVEGVASGSLTAYATLIKAGVSCFDIDFVQTRDGEVLATHPEDLQTAVDRHMAGGASGDGTANGAGAGDSLLSNLAGHVHEVSLAQLRAAGADEERFPTADTLIKVFAADLEQSGVLWKPGKGEEAPDYDELPVLLMDLKGPAFNPAAINATAAAAQAAEVVPHVALFVASDDQLQLVQKQTAWKGPLIRAYLDRQDANPAVSAEGLAPYALLGPSIKMSDAFFAAAARLGKPVLAWTGDTPADLHRAAEMRLNAVISNRPIALRAVLLDWRDRCSEQQRRQRHRRQLSWAMAAEARRQQQVEAERQAELR